MLYGCGLATQYYCSHSCSELLVSGEWYPPLYVNVDYATGKLSNHWIDSLSASFAGLQVRHDLSLLSSIPPSLSHSLSPLPLPSPFSLSLSHVLTSLCDISHSLLSSLSYSPSPALTVTLSPKVLAGDIDEAICTHALYYTLWRKYEALPERFNWKTKTPTVMFYPLRPELIESTYLLYQVW